MRKEMDKKYKERLVEICDKISSSIFFSYEISDMNYNHATFTANDYKFYARIETFGASPKLEFGVALMSYKDYRGGFVTISNRSHNGIPEIKSISMSPDKDKERVLQDFLNRFMPMAIDYWTEAEKRKKLEEERVERIMKRAKEISERTGHKLLTDSDIRFYGKVDGRLSYRGDEIYIDRLTVTIDQYYEICKIIGE